jgi:DmsE family decaheme c-type cytochrome
MRRVIRCDIVIPPMFITLLLSASLSLGAGTLPQEAAKPAAQGAASASDYATTAACAACHEEISKKFTRNPHQALEVKTGSEWKDRSCESCHGPAQAHIEAGDGSQIFSYTKSPSIDINANCRKCHGVTHEVAGMPNSMHGKNQLACTECHQIHDAKHPIHLLRAKPNELCQTCHKEMSASFSKPFAHHFKEGAIQCVDCHLPHQGLGVKGRRTSNLQLRASHGNDSPCLNCHTNIQGPFVYEHPPLRMEGCMSCHEPHGSINPKMLIRNQVRFLCLECHSMSPGLLASQPPSFHDLRSARYQNCTTCHLKIHGSNVNKSLLR